MISSLVTFFGAGIVASIVLGGGAFIITKIDVKDAFRIAFCSGISALILFVSNKLIVKFNIFSTLNDGSLTQPVVTKMTNLMKLILSDGYMFFIVIAVLFLIVAILKLLFNKLQKKENNGKALKGITMDDLLQYAIFDENKVIGWKDDTPDDVKADYQEYINNRNRELGKND